MVECLRVYLKKRNLPNLKRVANFVFDILRIAEGKDLCGSHFADSTNAYWNLRLATKELMGFETGKLKQKANFSTSRKSTLKMQWMYVVSKKSSYKPKHT